MYPIGLAAWLRQFSSNWSVWAPCAPHGGGDRGGGAARRDTLLAPLPPPSRPFVTFIVCSERVLPTTYHTHLIVTEFMYQHGHCHAHLASTARQRGYALKRQSIRITRNPRPVSVRPANKARHGTPRLTRRPPTHNGGLIRSSWRDESRSRALRRRGRHMGWVPVECG